MRTGNLRNVTHAIDAVDRNVAPIETPEAVDTFIASEIRDSSDVIQRNGGPHDVLAVHCKLSESRKTQFSRHKSVRRDDLHQQVYDWRDEVQLPHKYSAYKDDLIRMISDFQAMWYAHLGQMNVIKHCLELFEEIAKPVYSAPYRAGPRKREFDNVERDKMLAQRVIEPPQTECGAMIVFAPKKEGHLRFYVNYRRLNTFEKQDRYLFPSMDECIGSIGDGAVPSILDANSGYCQAEINETDHDKTAFTSHHRLYQFTHLSFVIKDTSGTLQRTMDVIPAAVKWQFALVYLGDIVIYCKSLEGHISLI